MKRLIVLVALVVILAQLDLLAKDRPDKQNGIRIEKDGVYLGSEQVTWDRLKEAQFNGARLIVSKTQFESLNNHFGIYFHNTLGLTIPRGVRISIANVNDNECTITASTRDKKAKSMVIAGIALEPDKPMQINFKINQETGTIDVKASSNGTLVSETSLTDFDISVDLSRDGVKFEEDIDRSPVKDPPVASQFKPNPPAPPPKR